MSKDDNMELIDLDDLPIPTRTANYPYRKWEEKLTPGTAIEITKTIQPRKASNAASTIMMAVRRQKLTFRTMVRNNRIWVYKEEEVEEIE